MVISVKGVFLWSLLAAAMTVGGCSSEDGEATHGTSDALTQRCSVRGDPPVTTGCTTGGQCKIVACTDSIPPSCWGTCETKAPVRKCIGSFACLCGTPVCVDGEWTCDGDCGPGDPIESAR